MSSQYDYEPTIRKLNPRITWKDCSGSCVLEGLESRRGTINVPADYDAPTDDANLKVTFWRFTSSKDIIPTIHLFILAGGPGNSGRIEDRRAEALVNFFGSSGLAVYLVDPRGLGESSPFRKGQKKGNVIALKQELLSSAPFPVTHLTARNTALDVGMITVAVQREPNYDSASTWHIFGGSYGALLGNQAILVMPNMFTSVYLVGLPRMRGLALPSGRGVAENCALNDYCRERLGGNVWVDFQKSIKNILEPKTNACTQAFSNVVKGYSGSSINDRYLLLIYLLRDLICGKSAGFKDTFVQQSQVVLLFLRVTNDCVDPDSYVTEVLLPMMAHMREELIRNKAKAKMLAKTAKETSVKGGSKTAREFDSFVNTIGILDIEFHSGPPQLTRPDDYDIHDDVILAHAYLSRYEAFKYELRDMKHTANVPLRTNTTHVFVEQGRLDLHTTYQPSKDAFDAMVAPEKTWYLLDSLGHESIMDECWFRRIATFLGFIDRSSSEKCLIRLNEHDKSDWTFETSPEIARWWKYVRKSGPPVPTKQQVLPIPNYTHIKMALSQIPVNVPPPLPPYPKPKEVPSRPYPGGLIALSLPLQIMLAFSVSLLLAIAIVVLYYFFVYRRSRSVSSTRPDEAI